MCEIRGNILVDAKCKISTNIMKELTSRFGENWKKIVTHTVFDKTYEKKIIENGEVS